MLVLLKAPWLCLHVDSLTTENHRLNLIPTSPCWGKAWQVLREMLWRVDICVALGHSDPQSLTSTSDKACIIQRGKKSFLCISKTQFHLRGQLGISVSCCWIDSSARFSRMCCVTDNAHQMWSRTLGFSQNSLENLVCSLCFPHLTCAHMRAHTHAQAHLGLGSKKS